MKGFNNISHAHYRSYFSLLRGLIPPEEICRRAAEAGADTAALCDINNFYGMVRFINAAEKNGIKPVSGADIASDGRILCTVYPRSRAGYGELNVVLSRILDAEREEEKCGISEDRRTDPLDLLCGSIIPDSYIVSANRGTLLRLRSAGYTELYAGLRCQHPFRSFARWARENGFPCAAFSNVVFSDKDDWKLYRLLQAIRLCCRVKDLPPRSMTDFGSCFAEAGEMENYFSAMPEALENTAEILENCDSRRFIHKSFIFPSFQGMDRRAEYARLSQLCLDGVARRYGRLTKKISDRLSYELDIIRKKGFAGYFLVVHDIVKRSMRTCGRGSSAASIVSYLLGITHVDPIRYNLFFERFLNMGRKDPPDIDVDFPWDERSEAFEYIFSAYPGSSAMVADHVAFGPRSCIREPAKAFGIEEDEIGRMMREWRVGRQELPDYISRAALRLRGMPRHIGTHPGGVVITPGPITDYSHIQTADCGLRVIAWEKDATEDAGLVKIDVLGNRSLGVLRDTINMVNSGYGKNIEWESFCPLDDPATREQIEKGDTLGIFYVESPATRQLLKKMGTGDYEHLVIASSIIRPAANRYINEFVRRLHGGRCMALHPAVEKTLRETYGIMVYQEDVSRIAIALCGFSPSEADRLRKILSKKDRETRMDEIQDLFFKKGEERGVHRHVLDELWKGILSFTGYSFCKAHSASYALVSYKLAWMKRFYPLEFMVSVINNGGGFYSRQVYVNAVRRMGFDVLGPDINKSRYLYSCEDGAMRIGFSQLKEISRTAVEQIILEREQNGPYKSSGDLFRRVSLNQPDLRVLVRSGCLDSISGKYNRPQLFWLYYHRNDDCYLFDAAPVPPEINDYPGPVKLLDEVSSMGIIYSRHPASIFLSRARKVCAGRNLKLGDSRSIAEHENEDFSLLGMIVTEKEVLTGKKDAMSFVSFEDEYSLFETVLFPKAYSAMAEQLCRGYIFVIQGRVEKEFDVFQINVSSLIPVNRIIRD